MIFRIRRRGGREVRARSSYSRVLSRELKQGSSHVRMMHRVFVEAMTMDEKVFPVCLWDVC